MINNVFKEVGSIDNAHKTDMDDNEGSDVSINSDSESYNKDSSNDDNHDPDDDDNIDKHGDLDGAGTKQNIDNNIPATNGEKNKMTEDSMSEDETENDEGIQDKQEMINNTQDDKQGTPTQRPYNLRTRHTTWSKVRFARAIDDPVSSKSYNTQFLQHDGKSHSSLREAVEAINSSGLDTKLMEYISGFTMTQMTARAGIKNPGKVAINALYQEFLQFRNLGVFEGQDATKLSKDKKGLPYAPSA